MILECILCISLLFPSSSPLLLLSSRVISSFLQSRNPNLNYAGLEATKYFSTPSVAIPLHRQMAIRHCLDNVDETIQVGCALGDRADGGRGRFVCLSMSCSFCAQTREFDVELMNFLESWLECILSLLCLSTLLFLSFSLSSLLSRERRCTF